MKKLIYILPFVTFILLASCKKEVPEKPRQETSTNASHLSPGTLTPSANAHDFLSGEKFTKLVIEVHYPAGYEPEEQSISILVQFLTQRINKPKGIVIKKSHIVIPDYGPSYSLVDIVEIEKNHRTQQSREDTLSLYILFIDKEYENKSSSSKILGINYGSSSVVIFENTIQQFSGGILQPSRDLLESTVLCHESGHILGLTNNGTSLQTQHQDVLHGAHCNNPNCLMYYAVETSDVVKNLTSSSPPQLDETCLVDLRANGGK